MRTKYFTCDGTGLKVWRYKDGVMMYYSKTRKWDSSSCKVSGEGNGKSWRQITRDEARKLESAAFPSKPRTSKPKTPKKVKDVSLVTNEDGSKSIVIKLPPIGAQLDRLASLFNYTPITDFIDFDDSNDWGKVPYNDTLTTKISKALTKAGGNQNNVGVCSERILGHSAISYKLKETESKEKSLTDWNKSV